MAPHKLQHTSMQNNEASMQNNEAACTSLQSLNEIKDALQTLFALLAAVLSKQPLALEFSSSSISFCVHHRHPSLFHHKNLVAAQFT